MFWRKLRTLVAQQWVGMIALFLVLATGTAYALPGSNTVFSDDIVNAEVTAADIGSGAVASDEIKNSTIAANDVAPNALGGGKITDGSLAGEDVRDGGLGGADVANRSLTSADISEATMEGLLPAATYGPTGDRTVCGADGGTQVCATAQVNIPHAGRLLVNATTAWFTSSLDDTSGVTSAFDDPTRVNGTCGIVVDGAETGTFQSVGERQQAGVASNHPPGGPGTMALTGLSGNLTAGGPHTIEVICTENDGDIDWNQINLTAMLVAPA